MNIRGLIDICTSLFESQEEEITKHFEELFPNWYGEPEIDANELVADAMLDAWETVYPDVALNCEFGEENDLMFYTGDEIETYARAGDGSGVSDEFNLMISSSIISVRHEDFESNAQESVYIQVMDATAGQYLGAVTPMLAAAYQEMEKVLPDGNYRRVLGVAENRNHEAWSRIAQKLGATLEG